MQKLHSIVMKLQLSTNWMRTTLNGEHWDWVTALLLLNSQTHYPPGCRHYNTFVDLSWKDAHINRFFITIPISVRTTTKSSLSLSVKNDSYFEKFGGRWNTEVSYHSTLATDRWGTTLQHVWCRRPSKFELHFLGQGSSQVSITIILWANTDGLSLSTHDRGWRSWTITSWIVYWTWEASRSIRGHAGVVGGFDDDLASLSVIHDFSRWGELRRSQKVDIPPDEKAPECVE